MSDATKEKENMVKFNADGKSVGRAATEVANLLRGKSEASFSYNNPVYRKVRVENVDRVRISGKKMTQKKYKRFSGYPSGLKETKLKDVFEKNPKEVFKHTVRGMLPKNKLQDIFMKNIYFE